MQKVNQFLLQPRHEIDVCQIPLGILQRLLSHSCLPFVFKSPKSYQKSVSDPVRPHRRQPTRLPHPWDSPGKNTGVGCHFLLQCMKVKSESEVTQSCPTLSDPMDCSLPGSSIHGIFQARVLKWVTIAFSLYSMKTYCCCCCC